MTDGTINFILSGKGGNGLRVGGGEQTPNNTKDGTDNDPANSPLAMASYATGNQSFSPVRMIMKPECCVSAF